MMNKKCDFVQIKLGFDHIFVVDSVGRSGRLILMWKAEAIMAKMEWQRDGDRNTKFFHVCVWQRQRGNRIAQIVDGASRICTTRGEQIN